MIITPVLSEFDPFTSAEGVLDPLGLYAIADTLAIKLVPGVRERMQHPRFLTAMAVGALITQPYGDEIMAKDGISAPWMVYEWHAVEGLVRTKRDELKGLPGVQKAKEAIDRRIPLCARNYLKTATVFGFHGVYRGLAENVDVYRNGSLGEFGYQLLGVWEKEQNLSGFLSGREGSGAKERSRIEAAVRDAMEAKAVTRSTGWEGWNFFGEKLFPNQIPLSEGKLLWAGLLGKESDSRSQVLQFLVSSEGSNNWETEESEEAFHQKLKLHVSNETRTLLEAISSYEAFARILQDAFEFCLFAMSKKGTKTTLDEVADQPACTLAHNTVTKAFDKTLKALEMQALAGRFDEAFSSLRTGASRTDWVRSLLDHHVNNQKRKPPQGKNPWFEYLDPKMVAIRPGYLRSEPPAKDGGYVHQYRTQPLWSFVRDLGKGGD